MDENEDVEINTQTNADLVLIGALPSGHVVVVGARHPIEAMFYADRVAYAEMPDPSTLQRLRTEGWSVIEGAP